MLPYIVYIDPIGYDTRTIIYYDHLWSTSVSGEYGSGE